MRCKDNIHTHAGKKKVFHLFRLFTTPLCLLFLRPGKVWATQTTLEVHWHKMSLDVQRSEENVWIKGPDRGEESLPHYTVCSAATLTFLHTHSGSLPLSESQFYLHSSLGLSSPRKTTQHPAAFPSCSKDLISPWRKWGDRAQQSAGYWGHRARGCLIWPFVSSAACSSEQDGRAEDQFISSLPHTHPLTLMFKSSLYNVH